jgi:hypothetical protein
MKVSTREFAVKKNPTGFGQSSSPQKHGIAKANRNRRQAASTAKTF